MSNKDLENEAKSAGAVMGQAGMWKEMRENLSKELGSGDPQWLKREQRRLEAERERKADYSRELLWKACIPARHSLVTPVNKGPWYEMYATIEAKLGTGLLVALVSPRGSGKTQMGVELIKAMARKQASGRYITATGFLLMVKSTYKSDEKMTERGVIDQFRHPKLLVIDELSKRKDTEWEFQLLFELINCRYNDMTDTILISNQTPVQFAESVGPSLSSRMKETGGIIECGWESYR